MLTDAQSEFVFLFTLVCMVLYVANDNLLPLAFVFSTLTVFFHAHVNPQTNFIKEKYRTNDSGKVTLENSKNPAVAKAFEDSKNYYL